jgi:hypothetical protein
MHAELGAGYAVRFCKPRWAVSSVVGVVNKRSDAWRLGFLLDSPGHGYGHG